MSRKQRVLKKRYAIFCEGDSEYNYIEKMRKNQGVELVLKPINMHGGGYSNFLRQIKKESQTNYLAKFIIVDADRIETVPGEKEHFIELMNYCQLQNQKGNIPHFVIADNPDFEYAACLHDSKYNGQNTKTYIEKDWGYKAIEIFKADKNIYDFLNSQSRVYTNLLDAIRGQKKLVCNEYEIKKKSFDIVIKKAVLDFNSLAHKGTNIEEFFDVIEW
ncbi:RloB domain-containing protein [Butyrivibrio sp. INlla16]|uniref:RloB domain-containing protein n=1 Tax=Butyrivibrio sp. INlla16 TaxID=1520807 RepID=UPI0008922C37|nr:RloB domain-containing protein [Butyrivibrio sp. INlla16]SDB51522.1 hypothetical protein SAMN02910263_02584 [Butyrivibrio sp. INlla16]